MNTKLPEENVQDAPTTGHEWDGIREYDKPLPRWWLYVFYACIVWSIGYWVAYPAWPLLSSYTEGVLGYSQRLTLEQEMAEVRQSRNEFAQKLSGISLKDIRDDAELLEFALAGGRSAYAVNCSQCHGQGAAGAKGYPNLNDDAWIWGGTLKDIEHTIRVGIRSDHEDTRISQMPAFLKDEILTEDQIQDMVEYVVKLSGGSADEARAAKAVESFKENCAACHREDGTGNAEFGAPNLTDRIWLYGGDREAVYQTIANSRNGVMPAWAGRLDDTTIKQLSVYIHSLGGGK